MVDIGIDKIQLNDFGVREIDLDHLRALATRTNKIKIISHSGQQGLRVEIYDGEKFAQLVVGQNWYHANRRWYVNLTLSPTYVNGHNLYNMSCTDYKKELPEILEYIKDTYRIDLDSEGVKIKTMEINCNIVLQQRYTSYVRVTRLLMSLLEIKCATMHDVNDGQTLMRKNKSIAVSIYNKRAQLKSKCKCKKELDDQDDPDIMRIEIRLLHSHKVEDVFGHNLWEKLDDGAVSEYMCRYITAHITEQYLEWCVQREEELVEMIIDKKERHKTKWQEAVIAQIRNKSEDKCIPYILDLEQVCDALYRLPDPHHNRSKVRNSLLSKKVDNDLYHNNDRAKVWEILGVFSPGHTRQIPTDLT